MSLLRSIRERRRSLHKKAEAAKKVEEQREYWQWMDQQLVDFYAECLKQPEALWLYLASLSENMKSQAVAQTTAWEQAFQKARSVRHEQTGTYDGDEAELLAEARIWELVMRRSRDWPYLEMLEGYRQRMRVQNCPHLAKVCSDVANDYLQRDAQYTSARAAEMLDLLVECGVDLNEPRRPGPDGREGKGLCDQLLYRERDERSVLKAHHLADLAVHVERGNLALCPCSPGLLTDPLAGCVRTAHEMYVCGIDECLDEHTAIPHACSDLVFEYAGIWPVPVDDRAWPPLGKRAAVHVYIGGRPSVSPPQPASHDSISVPADPFDGFPECPDE